MTEILWQQDLQIRVRIMSRSNILTQSAFADSAIRSSIVGPLQDFFSGRGIGAFVVGGAVRDALLGRESEDLDLTIETSATDVLKTGGDLAKALDARCVPLDRERGTVRLVFKDGRSLDLNAAPNGLVEDLARRDFTINSMALPLALVTAGSGPAHVIDLHGGLDDLNKGVIRITSSGVFEDDPVRLMRGPRLAAQLGLVLSSDTEEAIIRQRDLLVSSSPERVRDELLKLFAAPNAIASIRTLDRLGLLSIVIPEIDETRDVTQPKEHHWDVFTHCMETVGQIERILGSEPDSDDWVVRAVPTFPDLKWHFEEEIGDGHSRLTLLKLSGLLHDVGKPATKTIEETGRIRFFGHHVVGAEVANRILGRLRFGVRGRQFATGLVRHHLRPKQMSEPGKLPSKRAIYRYYRNVGEGAVSTLYLNMADYLAARGPLLEQDEWREHCDLMAHILDGKFVEPSADVAPSLITGWDVIEALSIEPGPVIGRLLEAVREAHAVGEIATRDEAIRLVNEKLATGKFAERYLTKS